MKVVRGAISAEGVSILEETTLDVDALARILSGSGANLSDNAVLAFLSAAADEDGKLSVNDDAEMNEGEVLKEEEDLLAVVLDGADSLKVNYTYTVEGEEEPATITIDLGVSDDGDLTADDVEEGEGAEA